MQFFSRIARANCSKLQRTGAAAHARLFAKAAKGGPHPGGKTAALDMALKQIESQYGKGSIMLLGARPPRSNIDVIPTGSLTLDAALGIGGLPRGRVVEVYGPESSGKTTLALHVIAEAQKLGGTCTFIDVEHALDPAYARRLGVDMNTLYLTQPDAGEQALEITDTLVRSGAMDVIVVDSVAALVPRAEIEGDMGDHHVALQARLMSQALRKLTSSLSKANCLIIFINQIRSKVGVLFGSPDVTSGGNALKFYSSVRLEIRRTGQIKQGDQIVGNTTRVKVVKNKMAPPFKQAEFDMSYGNGINKVGELVDLGVKFGLLEKAGAWYKFPDGDTFAQGRENAKAYFEADEPEYKRLHEAIRRVLSGEAAEEEAAAADVEEVFGGEADRDDVIPEGAEAADDETTETK